MHLTPYSLHTDLRDNSVRTFSSKTKKNPTSQCAPLDQFLVQWSTLASRICVAGTMVHQNLKRNWGVTMLVSELPRLELAKRGKNGIFAHIPPVHMKVYESNPLALYSIRGNIFLNFMGCTPMYTGIRVDSGTWVSAANPKNVIFSTFDGLLGGAIIILQPHKLAFCATGTIAHQNLKRKWGVTMLVCELPRLELAKRGKNGIFAHIPPCSYESVWIQPSCPL